MAHYRIIGWDKYQHYKDRDPPWIKLHRDTLTSQTWVDADDRTRVLAIACMLIAAGTDNRIPADPGFVRRRAYLGYDPDFQPLIDLGFVELVNDAKDLAENRKRPLAQRKQTLASDTECSSETEERQRREETDTAFAAFGSAAERRGWPKPASLTDERRKKLRARIRDHGIDGVTAAITRAEASTLINDGSWWSFDWFLKPANFAKLIEGNYDNRSTGPPKQAAGWN